MAQVLAHLGRAGRTVESDRVDPERLQSGQCRADLGTHEHGAGRLDRHMDDDREGLPHSSQRTLGADDRSLGL